MNKKPLGPHKRFTAFFTLLLVVVLCVPSGVFAAAVQNTNPTGDQSPTLSGNVEVGEVVWVNNVLQVRTRAAGTGTVRSVQLTTGTSNTGVVVNSSGNVGIGTVNPNYKLDVTGTIRTSSGGAISYGAGENYLIWNDDPEYSIVDDATDANYKTMKTFVASKSGSFKFKFSAYIQSGTFYWAWRVLKNGATVVSSGHYNSGLDVGEITSVHAYRRFVGTASDIEAGDSFALQMVSSDASGNPASGNGQILYAKEFRVYSTTPSVEHGGLSNVWGSRVGIGTITPAYKLDVTGDIRATGNVVAGGTMTANVGASNVSSGVFGTTAGKGNYTFEAAANTNNVLKVDATNERVGIGTGSPDSPLHISGPSQVTNLHAVHTWDGGADAQTMVKLETTRTANGGTSPQIFFKDNYTGGYNWKIGGDDTGVDFSILKAPVGTFPNTYVMKFQGSTGNVGIGTTSPGAKLEVNGGYLWIKPSTAGQETGMYLSNFSDTPGTPSFILSANDGNQYNYGQRWQNFWSWQTGGSFGFSEIMQLWGLQDGTTQSAAIYFNRPKTVSGGSVTASSKINMNGNSYFNINTGNVGIGTASPSYKLDISGGMRVSSGAATAGTFISTADAQIGLSSSDSWAGIGFADSGAIDDYIWFNGGNGTFAIGGGGASVANKKLHVDGGMTVGANYDATAVGANSLVVEGNISAGGTITANVSAPNVSAGTFGTTAGKGNYTFEAAANTNNVLKIDATNERVGIGTASPSGKLDVIGGNIRFGDSASYIGRFGAYNAETFLSSETANLPLTFYTNPGTGIQARVSILGNGNVGIGTTSPRGKLDVAWSGTDTGNIYFGDYTNGWAFGENVDASMRIYKTSNGTTLSPFLTISNGGNVGIGTTSPGAKLDVQDAGISGWKSLIIAKSSNSPAKVDIGVSSNEGMIQLYTSGGIVGTQIASHPAHTTYFNAGNVGIGITNPISRLHSYNSTADTVTGRTNIIDVLTLETTNTAASPFRGFGQGIEFRGRTYQNSTVRTLGRVATVLTDDSVTNTGTAIVFQNVADSATATAPVERMRIDYNGTVGIGTATPGSTYKLDVAGSARFSSPIEVGSPTAVNHATTKSYVDSILGTGGSGTSTASFATMYVSGTSTLAATTGKVIIGGAGPSLKLDVIGQGQFTDTISATKYYDYNDPTYYIDPANTGTSLKFAGAVQSDGTGINYMNGQLAVGTTNPGTYRLYVAGTSWFNNQVTINGNLIMNASSSITMGGGNIGSIGKITVQTIDPLYEIDGKKYATYAPSIAGGVKEEYVGRAKLEPTISNSKFQISNEKYEYVINFDSVPKGSDLWLWYQAVDFDRNNVEVIATAYGIPVAIAYEIEGKKIIFKTYNPQPTTHNGGGETYDEGIEFSYRLIGNRHDWKEWPTYSKDQKETPSFILKSK